MRIMSLKLKNNASFTTRSTIRRALNEPLKNKLRYIKTLKSLFAQTLTEIMQLQTKNG